MRKTFAAIICAPLLFATGVNASAQTEELDQMLARMQQMKNDGNAALATFVAKVRQRCHDPFYLQQIDQEFKLATNSYDRGARDFNTRREYEENMRYMRAGAYFSYRLHRDAGECIPDSNPGKSPLLSRSRRRVGK